MIIGELRKTQASYLTLASLLAAATAGGVLAWANLRWTIRLRPPSTYCGGTWLWDNEKRDTGFYEPETASTFTCRERGWPFGFRSVVLSARTYDGSTVRMPPDMIGRARLLTRPSRFGAIIVDTFVGVALIVLSALAARRLTRWVFRMWSAPNTACSEERP